MYPYTIVSCCRSMCCIIEYNAVCQLAIKLACTQEEVMCFLSINSHAVKYYVFLYSSVGSEHQEFLMILMN